MSTGSETPGSEKPGPAQQALPLRAASPHDPEHSSVGAVAVVVIFAIFGGMMVLAIWLAIPWEDVGLPGAGPAPGQVASQPQRVAPPADKP